jgi:hypothetical protein
MSHLILPGDNTTWFGFSLLGESSLSITLDETGGAVGDFNALEFLVLSGTTSVSIASNGAANGANFMHQLLETTNNLTTPLVVRKNSSSGAGLATATARTV